MAKYERHTIEKFGGLNTQVDARLIEDNQAADMTNLHQVTEGSLDARQGCIGYDLTVPGSIPTTVPAPASSLSFAAKPFAAILTHEYITDAGIPGVGFPGIETVPGNYEILVANIDNANPSTAAIIFVINCATNQVITWFEKFLDIDGATQTALVNEANPVVKAVNFHGRAYLPLWNNQELQVWIENGTWYCKRTVLPDLDVNLIEVDARVGAGQENNPTGGISAPLVLTAWQPQKTIAPQTQSVPVSNAQWLPNGNKPIICRADFAYNTEYVDVAKDPIPDPTLPPQVVKQINVNYFPRKSPNVSTANANIPQFDYQSPKDIKYTPPNQTQDYQTNMYKDQRAVDFPYGAWDYRFVCDLGNGQYTNTSGALSVGNLLFSALQSNNASDLHSSFNTPIYDEPVSGLSGSTLVSSTGTTLTVQTGDGAKFPAIPPPGGSTLPVAIGGFIVEISGTTTNHSGDDGVMTIYTRCTNITGDVLTIDALPTYFSFVDATVQTPVFAAGATVKAYYGKTSEATPASSFLTGSAAILSALKKQIYLSSYIHATDDAYITAYDTIDDTIGSFLQIQIGGASDGSGHPINHWQQDFSNYAPNCGNNFPAPCIYGTGGLVDANNVLRRYLGMTIDMRSGSGNNASGTPYSAYPGLIDGSNHNAAYYNIPNVVRVTRQVDDLLQALNPSTAAGLDYLFINGFYDWEFMRNVSELQGAGLSVWLEWYDQNNNPFGAFIKDIYSMRKLLPATRMLWDWQLSQTIPTSIIFNAPRIALKIPSANVPAGTQNVLIFRTLNSLDPAYSSEQMALVATVPYSGSGDFYYFDQIKDTDLDFGNTGSTPQNYEGLRFGIAENYIESQNEVLWRGYTKEFYQPLTSRGVIQNTVDAINPENTTCRLIKIQVTGTPVNSFGSGATPLYKSVWRDSNSILSVPESLTLLQGNYSSGNFIVVGYFMPMQYQAALPYLDIYRSDDSGATYHLIKTLETGTGGVLGGDGGYLFDDNLALGAQYNGSATKSQKQTIVDPEGIRYSDPAQPNFITSLNLVDMKRGDGDPISGLQLANSNVYVAKTHKIGQLLHDIGTSSPGVARVEWLSNDYGCIAPCTMREYNGTLVYLSSQGLIATESARFFNIDKDIKNDIQAYIKNNVADRPLFQGFMAPRYNEYVLVLNTAASETATAYPIKLDPRLFADPESRKDYSIGKFVYPNRKMFMLRSDNQVVSALIKNPGASGAYKILGVVAEDQDNIFYDYVYAANSAANTYFNVAWSGRKVMGSRQLMTSNHIHRVKWSRLLAQHRQLAALSLIPLEYTLMLANAGAAPGNVTSDTTRYHFATPDDTTFLDELRFIHEDACRGLWFQPTLACAAYYFRLMSLDIAYHTERIDA